MAEHTIPVQTMIRENDDTMHILYLDINTRIVMFCFNCDYLVVQL